MQLDRAGFWSLVLLTFSVFLLLIFRSTDQMDVRFSELFFTQEDCETVLEGARCGRFLTKDDPFWQSVREAGHNLPLILMAATSLHLIWLLMFKRNKRPEQLYPPLIALVVGLAGPLLLVNLVLKEYWGRPRPYQTSYFAGEHPYVPPGDISSYCESNCSFVSGEAAAAFWMLALIFYLRGRMRIWFAVLIFPLASFISVLRISFGRHYISDVVMAAMLIIFLIAFSAWLLQSKQGRNLVVGLCRFSNRNAFGKKNENS